MSTAKKLRNASRDGRLGVWVASAPEPNRDVVRHGLVQPEMWEPGADPKNYKGRSAMLFEGGWRLYQNSDQACNHYQDRTEAEAIAWCLDGTLPKH